MNEKIKIKIILTLIEKLWEKYPEQRFGQLLMNYVFDGEPMFHQNDLETEHNLMMEILK